MDQSFWPVELEVFSRSRLFRSSPFKLGQGTFSSRQVLDRIRPQLTSERIARLDEVVGQRTFNVVPVLENLYDLGNISAVFRSAEAFGFLEIDLVVPPGARFKSGNRVARGADKWLDLKIFKSPMDCVMALKSRGFRIYATTLENSQPIEDFDFSGPTAVVLGNEKEGVSSAMLAAVDGALRIPMTGFTQSFNISVAAAIGFYHIWRDRERRLGKSGDLSADQREVLLANYYLRCLDNPEAVLMPNSNR